VSSSRVPWKQHLGTVLRYGIAALILGCLVLYTAQSWSQLLHGHLWRLAWGALIASLVLLLVAQAVMFAGWHLAFCVMGGSAPLLLSARSYWVSQLAKYVPGKVVTVVARAYVLREADVREETAVAALLVEVAMVCVSAAVVGVACLPFVPGVVERLEAPWLVVAALSVPLGLLGVHPRLLQGLMNVAARLLKRERLQLTTSYPQLLLVALVFCAAWVILGASFAFLAQALGYGRPPLALAIGGYALSWTIGFLAFFTPGGLGVREVVLTAVLALALPSAGAAALALAARLQTTLCEVLWNSALALYGRVARARGAPAQPGPREGGGS